MKFQGYRNKMVSLMRKVFFDAIDEFRKKTNSKHNIEKHN